MEAFLFILVLALIAGGLWLRRRQKRLHKQRLLATPLTAQQRDIVQTLVPIVRRLPASLRPMLEGKINLFLDQITFRGNGGIEVSDEMRLSIAAQACLLIVNSPAWYETLRNVLIYPTAFHTHRGVHDGYIVHEGKHTVLGESWNRGPVVLSWQHSLDGGLNDEDGHNVVIHEFAHQLDSLTGATNGIPILRKGQAYAGWEDAMLDAFNDHLEAVESGRETLIDPYGATGHEEFFAEAIVVFFEKPVKLREGLPALYGQLSQLLGLDPASWT